jgi:hypothetical protein
VLNQSEHTRIVKEIASQLGFAHCGISKAEFLEEETYFCEFKFVGVV